ncbi:RAC1 [Mytilus edulis]|uniref:RAC1 n=1 Tax=Mytilus edulis TaxID=6550 RepID=A0A8S3UCA8_MYTED|nr:RAC1 [Mytilus edulis]
MYDFPTKRHFSIFTQLRTGYTEINYYKNRVGQTNAIESCNCEAPETPHHFLLECPCYENKREDMLHQISKEEDYDRLRPLSYPQTDIVLFCFSISGTDSLENITSRWIPEIDRYIPDCPRVLVGCKSDLRTSNPNVCVPRTEIEKIAKDAGLEYYETSALIQDGLKHCFDSAIRCGLAGSRKKTKSKSPF